MFCHKIFLSYSSRNAHSLKLAAELASGLRNDGYTVFHDKSDLPAGDSFDDRIRKAVKSADGMIFLAYPEAVEPGAYTLTELGYAKAKWPRGRGKVLPVLLGGTKSEDLDAYLRVLNVMQPEGNARAEILSEALRMWRPRSFLPVAVSLYVIVFVLIAFFAPTDILNVTGRLTTFVKAQFGGADAPQPAPNTPELQLVPLRSTDVFSVADTYATEGKDIAINADNTLLTIGATFGAFQATLDDEVRFQSVVASQGTSLAEVTGLYGRDFLGMAGGGGLVRVREGNETPYDFGTDKSGRPIPVRDYDYDPASGEIAVVGGASKIEVGRLSEMSSSFYLGGIPFQPGNIWFSQIAQSPNAVHLAVGRSDGDVYLSNRADGTGPTKVITSAEGADLAELVFSGDGRFLAAAYRSGRIVVWDTLEADALFDGSFGSHFLTDVAFHPDPNHLGFAGYTTGGAGLLGLADLANADHVAKSQGGPVNGLAFSRDGTRLFATGKSPILSVYEVAVP